MYSPNTAEPQILSGAVRPIDCFRDGLEIIKDQYWIFLGIVLVAAVLTGLTCGILSATLMCGVALSYLAKARRQMVQFDTLFRGFDFFKASLLIFLIWLALYLVTGAPNIVFAIATNPLLNKSIPASGDPTTVIAGYGLSVATSFVQQLLQMLMLIACLFLVDRNLPALEATKASFRMFAVNLGPMIALALLCTLASLVGTLACCIGVFFVMPIVDAAIAVSYFQAVPGALGPAVGFQPPPPDPFRPPYG